MAKERDGNKQLSLRKLMWTFLILSLLSLAFFVFYQWRVNQLYEEVSELLSLYEPSREELNEIIENRNEVYRSLHGGYGILRRRRKSMAAAIVFGLGFVFTGIERLRRHLTKRS